MKTTPLATALVLAFAAAASVPAFAADKSLEQAVTEARLEGQIGTAFLLNRHLNPFEISVDVEGDTAILTGEVDESIDRELAERVALNAKGIKHVDNKITMDGDAPRRMRDTADNDRDFDEAIEDASVTAAVKSRLLWNDTTDGLDIEVDTMGGNVTLTGNATTQAEKDLATRLARRTDGVRSVSNKIEIKPSDGGLPSGEKAGEAIADSWITTKVKSSLLMSNDVDGLDLTVETKDGVVTLGGAASSAAERDLAVEIAKDIKGVKSVNASSVDLGVLAANDD
jgi:osmotically-inducible protein OsmY